MRLLPSWLTILSISILGVQECSSASVSDLPKCALSCMQKNIAASSCSATNSTCLCANAELANSITLCVGASCTVRESLTTQKYSKTSCGVVSKDRRKYVSITGVVGSVCACIAFALRMWSRIKWTGTIGLDDYIIALSVALMIPLSAMSVILANTGLGLDMWSVPFDNITYILYMYFWDELIYLSCLPLTKISILIFYLRIFPTKSFRIGVLVLIACNVAYLISFVLISVWQCRPISGAWLRWDGTFEGICNNIHIQGWTSAAFNIVLDFGMLILPLPEIFRLSLDAKKKARSLVMFSVGFFVTIVSILRLETLIHFANTHNLTQDYVPLGYWSTIEIHMGIICACMPAIHSLFKNAVQTALSSRDKSRSSEVPNLGAKKDGAQRFSVKPKNEDSESFVRLVDQDAGSVRKDNDSIVQLVELESGNGRRVGD